jgi:predicted cupin superfamily sugar epimerase
MPTRAAELIAALQLQPHPEGGFYREVWRGALQVAPADGRAARSALTSIDFLLQRGQFSAWHRVASDEAWHLLEGGPLRLWLMPPGLERIESVELAPVSAGTRPRHTVPAHWWQAAEPIGEYAYTNATVGPGFEFADFAFLRADVAAAAAVAHLDAALLRLR